jgi:hypothetical protein
MLGVTALCLWLTACALGPDYRLPQPTVPQRWTEQPATTAVDPRPDLSEWWRGFRDPRLNRLIERAMQGNLDLQQARALIQAARAQQNVVDAERWPSVSAFSGYQRQRISPNALLGALGTIQNNGNQPPSRLACFRPWGPSVHPSICSRPVSTAPGSWTFSAAFGANRKRRRPTPMPSRKAATISKSV